MGVHVEGNYKSILNHNDEQRYMIPAQDFKIRDGHEST